MREGTTNQPNVIRNESDDEDDDGGSSYNDGPSS